MIDLTGKTCNALYCLIMCPIKQCIILEPFQYCAISMQMDEMRLVALKSHNKV